MILKDEIFLHPNPPCTSHKTLNLFFRNDQLSTIFYSASFSDVCWITIVTKMFIAIHGDDELLI